LTCFVFMVFFIVKKGRKRKAPTASTKKTKEEPAVVEDQTTENDSTKISEIEEKETVTKEKPTKKAKKPLPEGYNSGVYTELEEKNFLEGLELYGRDWGEVKKNIII
jgi:hypothetical protein